MNRPHPGPTLGRSWVVAELPVALLLGLLAVTVAWPAVHLAASLLWMAALGWHVRARVLPALRIWVGRRRVPRRLRLLSSIVVVVLAAAVVASGIARWAGAPPSLTWHGGLSWSLLAAVALHVALVKGRKLRRRPGPGRFGR